MAWIDRLAGSIQHAPNGCHIWTKALNSRGYGVSWFDGKLRLAHRVAWFHCMSRWPADGMVLDHLCNTKACVNPEHLIETTNRLNILRSPASPMNVMAARTACGRGHKYTESTLRMDSRGHRQCRACDLIRSGGGPIDLV